MSEITSKVRTSTGSLPKGRYIEAIGRRKTSIARVRISESARNSITVNDKTLDVFFPVPAVQKMIQEVFVKANISQKFGVTAKVNGGGIMGQAESVRLGIARALVVYDAETRTDLKKAGYLKRDPRSKERRKFGLKKARKAAQWSKR